MRTEHFSLGKLVTSLVVVFCAASYSYASDIAKSQNDTRDYQSITLENGLSVLLVSDPDTDKAAASLNVNIGSAANPKNRAGLAHFLEHMLFLGTDKYPEAGEYQAFIQSHGGSHNAFTALKNTNYFFDINADDLEPALDRFSQFFIAPLFSEEYTDRERHAVHSEYSAKRRDDGRRTYAATQQSMNPAHPASRFAVGNLDTLSNDKEGSLRSDLIKFYQQYYSANQMNLVIIGKQPLNQLESIAQQYFSTIKNTKAQTFIIDEPQFKPEDLPLELAIKTLKDTQSLSLSFPTQANLPFWKSKPLYLLSSLIGYEGEGSLLALLKEKGWATGLGASPGQSFASESSFHIQISLTPEGLKHTDNIVSLFFSFIQSIKKEGISQAIYNEEKLLNAQQFRFLAEQEPIHYVTQLTQSMQDFPQKNWLNAPYLLEQYDLSAINQFTQAIRPDNMVLSVKARNLETNFTEAYYDSEYSINKISANRIKYWQQAELINSLHIRNANPFIAENTNLQPGTDNQLKPIQLDTGKPGVTLWQHQDTTFKVPKADLYFTLLTPLARNGAEVTTGLNLYTDMVSDELNKSLYDAGTAGLSARIYAHQRGISVRISGFDDKIEVLSKLIAKTLRKPELSQARFKRVLQAYQEQLKNSDKDKPYNQLFRVSYEVLMHNASLSELQKTASNYSLEQLSSLVDELFKSIEVRILSHGNLTASQAKKLTNALLQELQPIQTAQVAPQIDILRLEESSVLTKTLDIEHNDSATILYLQGDNLSTQTRAATALLSEILSAPFYTQLRTEQQLGYIVFATPMPLRKVPGIAFIVQSPTSPPKVILGSIRNFLNSFRSQLKTIPKQQIAQFKSSVVARINAQERQLQELSNRFWQEIDQNNTKFDTQEKLTKAINQLTNRDLVNIYDKLLARQLVLQNTGAGAKLNLTSDSAK
ncbi:insulinase family protein [Neptunomonas japonica]|uniref:Protease 3 n=1 Tax=Neptunomonas japonica JAMM 1380 TaxID=1441457 RepID=A0A7R6PT21_9GAMM|nr:insulinase family protein [Neptunomonas japonica]BBB28948.1 peptidase M16 [Neptunomonas japonica JAMM 1380]